MCLAILSVEDIEDLYIFRTMITGYLLIGLGITLVYRGIRKTVSAVHSPTKLPDLIDGVSRAVSAQTVGINRNMENTLERAVSALTVVIHRKMDIILESAVNAQTVVINRIMDNTLERAVNAQMVVINRNMENILERAVNAQTVAVNRNMDNILEKFSALLRRMNRFEDQNGQIE